MEKRTIKKTYFVADNSFIYSVFGLDGNDNRQVINRDNVEYLREYIDDYIGKYGENDELTNCLQVVEKELENVDEVQVIWSK